MARRGLRPLAGAALLLVTLFSAAALCSAEPEDASAAEDPLIEQVVGAGADGDELELNAEAHFASFVRRFGKSYRDEDERAHRMSVFKANLRRARRHQRLDPTAVHGVTQFSDLTPAEFRRQFLGLRRSSARDLLKGSSAHKAPILPTDGLPTDFDWREHGAVGPVKNQGSCGSCWSFSTSGALEGAHYLATGKLEVLSEQQMVDCDHECDASDPRSCDAGCNGGLMTTAFSYLEKVGGLESEKDYPYTGSDSTCKFDKSKIVAQVKNFSVVSVDEDQIAANLVKHGPLAIGINAVFMQTYIGGVSCPYICGRHLDHGVLLVGYGSAGYAPIRFKEKPYWIIKNSWGENWGENGYYKICRGPHAQNKCGVDSMVSTVTAIHASKKE
ncbi:cysteine proteinase 1-like [Panicum miliaceum]|uniref:Cysteine proteinase 1-like n=1 Tax=Panicum miliaceum TaxID=4540 RepID=A0A3L6Q208_PANMI|nr:cysteine proteinase 1-like [Panicum miliaceum]